MTVGTLQIDGRRFRIVPEDEYKTLRAAMRWQQRQAKLEADELTEARRRLRDPKRKTIPLSQLKKSMQL